MDILKELPDNSVDLVLTDPPYGINFGTFNRTNTDAKGNRYKADEYKQGDWDKEFDFTPFWEAIKNKSEHQIIWGGNYFPCLWTKPTKGIIFWQKNQPCKNFSDGELAWTSYNKVARCFDYSYYGNIEGNTSASKKYHPTQKPLQLFKRLLEDYLPDGGTVLDPFSGSGTTALACHDLGYDFICIEKDPDYHKTSVERLEAHQRQGKLF